MLFRRGGVLFVPELWYFLPGDYVQEYFYMECVEYFNGEVVLVKIRRSDRVTGANFDDRCRDKQLCSIFRHEKSEGYFRCILVGYITGFYMGTDARMLV